MLETTGTELGGLNWGHKIPGKLSSMQWRGIAVAAAAIWALQSMLVTVAALAIIAVAIEPGPLNIAVAWVSLGALASMLAPHQVKRETKLMRWLRKPQGLSFILLLVCDFVDGRAVVANWNVDRAMASPTYEIDFDYLLSLGPSALPALNQLAATNDKNTVSNATAIRIAKPFPDWQQRILLHEFAAAQGNWRSWTLRLALLGL